MRFLQDQDASVRTGLVCSKLDIAFEISPGLRMLSRLARIGLGTSGKNPGVATSAILRIRIGTACTSPSPSTIAMIVGMDSEIATARTGLTGRRRVRIRLRPELIHPEEFSGSEQPLVQNRAAGPVERTNPRPAVPRGDGEDRALPDGVAVEQIGTMARHKYLNTLTGIGQGFHERPHGSGMQGALRFFDAYQARTPRASLIIIALSSPWNSATSAPSARKVPSDIPFAKKRQGAPPPLGAA